MIRKFISFLRRFKAFYQKCTWSITKISIILFLKFNLLKYPKVLSKLSNVQYPRKIDFLINILKYYKTLLITGEERNKFEKNVFISIFRKKNFFTFNNYLKFKGIKLKFISSVTSTVGSRSETLFCKVIDINKVPNKILSEIEDVHYLYSHSLSTKPNIIKKINVKIFVRQIKNILMVDHYLLIKKKLIKYGYYQNSIVQYAKNFNPLDLYTCCYNSLLNIHYDNYVTFNTKIIPKKSLIVLEKAILFSEKASTNYFHWVFESILKIMSIDNIPNNDAIPIIIESNMPSQHYELLQLIIPNFEKRKFCLFTSYRCSYFIKNLIVPDVPNYFSDNFREADIDRALIAKKHLKYGVDRILGEINFTGEPSPKKIYLDRTQNSARHIINSRPLKKFLKTEGFVIVRTQYLSIEEQIKLFRNADTIIAPSGAALTNIIFCKPNTNIIVLTSEYLEGDCIFYSLAKISNLNCYYLGCETGKKTGSFKMLFRLDLYDLFWQISNFKVNIDDLKELLVKISN